MMALDIAIPPAALEAGARALARYNCEKWDNDPDRWRAYFTDEARAAFLAMIEAWEGAKTIRDDGRRQTYAIPAIILPLPQEITLNAQDISALDVKSIREGISDE